MTEQSVQTHPQDVVPRSEFNARVEALQKEFGAQLRGITSANSKMMDLQRQEIMAEAEAGKSYALELEDRGQRRAALENVEKRERQRLLALNQVEKAAAEDKQPVPAAAPEAKARADAWLEQNSWLRDNPRLMRMAGQIEIPNRDALDFNKNPEAHLDYIKSELRSLGITVPDDGEDADTDTDETPAPAPGRRSPVSAVEGSSRRGVSGISQPKVKGYKELPAKARAACEQLVKSRFSTSTPVAKLEAFRKGYAENYWTEYSE